MLARDSAEFHVRCLSHCPFSHGDRHARSKGALLAVTSLLSIAFATPARADLVTFTSLSAWNAAVSGVGFSVDFEGLYPSTRFFGTTPLDVGPFTMFVNNGSSEFADAIEVNGGTVPASFGTAAAFLFVDARVGNTVDLLLDAPIRAFFAEFFNAGNSSPLGLTLQFVDGTSTNIFVSGGGRLNTLEPFGFTSTQPVSRIRFTNDINDGFYVDNILGRASVASLTPEPTTLMLVVVGVTALALASARPRATLRSIAIALLLLPHER